MATIKQLKEICNQLKNIDAPVGDYAKDTLESIKNGCTSIKSIKKKIEETDNQEALKIHIAIEAILNAGF